MDGSDLIVESALSPEAQAEGTDNAAPAKKKFITPEVSVPVDVLEATTFFQAVGSGATN